MAIFTLLVPINEPTPRNETLANPRMRLLHPLRRCFLEAVICEQEGRRGEDEGRAHDPGPALRSVVGLPLGRECRQLDGDSVDDLAVERIGLQTQAEQRHPIEDVGSRLRGMMPFLNPVTSRPDEQS